MPNVEHNVEVMLIAETNGAWKGLGSHRFYQLPRLGELIELEIEERGHMYRVIAVAHNPSGSAVIDVYASHVGPTTTVLKQLIEGATW